MEQVYLPYWGISPSSDTAIAQSASIEMTGLFLLVDIGFIVKGQLFAGLAFNSMRT
jgi:hypothetical protein